MRLGDGGEVPAQPLCARLANMQRSTDSAYRGNTISCQVSREHHRGALPKRIGHGTIVLRARCNHRRLRAASAAPDTARPALRAGSPSSPTDSQADSSTFLLPPVGASRCQDGGCH